MLRRSQRKPGRRPSPLRSASAGAKSRVYRTEPAAGGVPAANRRWPPSKRASTPSPAPTLRPNDGWLHPSPSSSPGASPGCSHRDAGSHGGAVQRKYRGARREVSGALFMSDVLIARIASDPSARRGRTRAPSVRAKEGSRRLARDARGIQRAGLGGGRPRCRFMPTPVTRPA
jgi:hypothetical protein